MTEALIYWLLIFVMLVGCIGALVPALPGSSLILIAVLVWGFLKGFGSVTVALAVTVVVLVASVAIDTLSGIWGAQRAGASQWGQIGAIAGLVAGFLGLLPALPVGGPLLGVLFGPAIGAFLGEFIYRRATPLGERAKTSAKATLGIILGSLLGNVVQGVLALVATIVFVVTTWGQAVG